MKNILDFKVPFVGFTQINFIDGFTSAYMFVENLDISGEIDYPCPPRKGSGPCHGCGNFRKGKCENAAVNKVSPYSFLFNTMSGNCSLRRRYDGKPTELQKFIGGIEYTADFLFGFTGYQYRKCSDHNAFKNEITASINAGRPILAELKENEGFFDVITGYDGDTLICPTGDYFYKKARPNGAPAYGDLAALYIFGEKTVPRYKLIDGLKNIRKVMEYNINEKLWDEYLAKMGGWEKYPSDDGLDKADIDEIKERMNRMLDTVRYSMITHIVIKAFQNIHIRHEEMRDPALSGLWENISKTSKYMGHGIENKIAKINWDTIRASTFRSMSAEICDEIIKVKKADIEVFGYINQAVNILEK